ncbi:hypothetical protein BROUX41_005342 [Berkeleyomyces rouxiae]|uniref:uncharacterized protein n=1 Tax=Berkeleyomyces rouxiae TaxID=2035830 RepID=UPI003B81285D
MDDSPGNRAPKAEPTYTRTIKTKIHLQPQPENLSPHSVDSSHSRLRRVTPKSTTPSKRLVPLKPPTKLKVASSAPLKPLVPKTERKHQEHNIHTRIRKNSDVDRLAVESAGDSSQRHRGLSVSNVGNNGKIYLRPVVRPANQRYFTQPNAFPATPPTTAGPDAAVADTKPPKSEHAAETLDPTAQHNQLQIPTSEQASGDLHLSQWEPPSPTTVVPIRAPTHSTPNVTQISQTSTATIQGRRRAVSDATRHNVPITTSVTMATDEGSSAGLKIVISQNHGFGHDHDCEHARPRTAEEQEVSPFIDVSIPSPRIGRPRFTVRGTPVLRVSNYTATEDLHSSIAQTLSAIPTPLPRSSHISQSIVSPSIHGASREPTWMMVQTPRRFLPSMPTIPMLTVTPANISRSEPTTPMSRGSIDQESLIAATAARATYIPTHQEIGPSMFDFLTFKPMCDDGDLVRYSPAGAVMAATPARLIAEITSPSILDYEMLSDFFLTFRAFLEPLDLIRMLISRFHWAADRNDEIGMVVRVRTFVALRHWILNYFVDDFMPNLELRVSFCNLVNELNSNLAKIGEEVSPHQKIVGELKKCWRRVCAQFWDTDGLSVLTSSDPDITPGGIAGHRDANINPAYWERKSSTRPSIDSTRGELENNPSIAAVIQDPSPRVDFSLAPEASKSTRKQSASEESGPRHGLNPLSVSSIDVASCTFPTSKNLQKFGLTGTSKSHSTRLVTAQNLNTSGGVATAPKGIVGKRVRPHKRNGSMSDSLRDRVESVNQPAENSENAPFTGSLMRGDLFPPSQALVEAGHSLDVSENMRWSTMDNESDQVPVHRQYGSGPAVKKLFDTVKRALSTTRCPITGIRLVHQELRLSRLLSNPTPSSGVVPLVRSKKFDNQPTVRVDLLGASIADAFKAIVHDGQTGNGFENRLSFQDSVTRPGEAGTQPRVPTFDSAHLDGSFDETSMRSSASHRHNTHKRVLSDGAITAGSKSIMIINDTRHEPFDLSTLPNIVGLSYAPETFAEPFAHTGDLTPPSTPPDPVRETLRHTSHLANHSFFVRPADVNITLPPFVPDLQSFLEGGCLSPNQAFRSPQTATFPRAIALAMQAGNAGSPLSSNVQTEFRVNSSGPVAQQESSPSCLESQADDSIVASTVTQSHHNSTMSGVEQQRTSFHGSHHTGHRRSISASSFGSSASHEVSDKAQPARMLRRRPAGNLREVSTVNDLDQHLSMFRSRSMTTIDTFTDSVRSSYRISYNEAPVYQDSHHEAVSPSTSEPPPHTIPLSSPASPSTLATKKLSLFSTHSSMHRPMRSSFEAELRKLAAIPDDVDGGVEIALMKLEGRYEKPATFTELTPAPPRLRKQRVSLSQLVIGNRTVIDTERRKNRQTSFTGEGSVVSPIMNMADISLEAVHVPVPPVHNSFLPAGPMPLYEADKAHDSGIDDKESFSQSSCPEEYEPVGDANDKSSLSMYRDSMNQSTYITDDDGSTEGSQDLASISSHPLVTGAPVQTDKMTYEDGISNPKIRISGSFLDSNSYSEYVTRNSLDLADAPSTPSYLGPTDSHGSAGLAETENSLSHVVPPSPPMTLKQTINIPGSCKDSPKPQAPLAHVNIGPNIMEMHQSPLTMHKPLPPTPEATPTTTHSHEANYDSPHASQEAPETAAATQTKQSTMTDDQRAASHLPFILAFDSNVLAQQFTLIEKEALVEIDWRELVEMGWKTSAIGLWRSWLDFLQNSNSHGIDVVVARFNIMVKWAVSEIVLTQNINERARCIIKLIHIAQHCRRYRNFASLAQITMALTSPEVTRLTKTWSLVPAAEVRVVQSLETLMTPTRNFYNIRSEMETGSDKGCIPFVGIYMHDLTYNSQRPAHVPAASRTAMPLVNFERYRRTAAVVKTLLRLFEASTLYDFQTIEGITERCLWVCALGDDEIRSRAAHME